MAQYSILLVDDHTLFRQGLRLLLENLDYISHIHEADSETSFLKVLHSSLPDIIFMDIEMPDKDGITLTREALNKYPNLRIVALSMYGDEHYYSSMIKAGAKGFILKNSEITDVENAIQQVMSGGHYFSQDILNNLIRGLSSPEQKPATDLTERETEVLSLICQGLSNKDIATRLYLSKRTVDKHRENLLIKTDSNNTAGLVMYAVKKGIVVP